MHQAKQTMKDAHTRKEKSIEDNNEWMRFSANFLCLCFQCRKIGLLWVALNLCHVRNTVWAPSIMHWDRVIGNVPIIHQMHRPFHWNQIINYRAIYVHLHCIWQLLYWLFIMNDSLHNPCVVLFVLISIPISLLHCEYDWKIN